ncbi:MAG: hypothetical protein IT303_13715 [Dehalococcoidia bacterium]|nr:hypothetical protein [Dehalococcoidia bacterium]
MDIDQVARDVYDRVRSERDGTVIAVWGDGGVEVVGFGYRGRRTHDGAWLEPIASVPAKAPITYHEIRTRIERGLRRHGLLPPDAGAAPGR